MNVHNPEIARAHRRKQVGWALAVLIVVAAVAAFAVRKVRGPTVPAVVAKKTPLAQKVVVSGRVTPPAQISIAPNLTGTVSAVKVEEGDVVAPGAVLVELEAAELDAAVAQAEASLLQSRARLTQLLQVSAPTQAEAVRQAELNLDQAQRRADRVKALASAGSLTQQELDDAQSALDLARSRLSSARAQAASTNRGGADVRAAEASVAQAEAMVAAAKARRGYATLTSPVKAQVLKRDVEPGDAVSPGRALLVLARVGATRLSVEPDEKNLAYIQPGQKAVASADAFPDQRFQAQVETVAPAVNPERGTVEVKLLVPEPPAYLRPDMTVSVEIEVAAKAGAIVIPAEAVQDASTPHPWVLKANGGKAERAEVKLGLSGQGRVEVVDGVREGEVLLLPASAVPPGARVRPAPKEG